MKKVLLVFLSLFVSPAFASGINANTNSAPCTNNTLETYSGNTNLAADWQPNEIQLRWYNNNTLMDVQSAANTCTYDDTLTIPSTAPTRTGYTFDGWTVRPEINFATTIPTNVAGIERWAIGWNNNANCCFYDTNTNSAWNVNCNSDSTYTNELQTHEWKVKFSHGDLYGMAKCSAKTGNTHNNTWDINNKSDWASTYDELDSAIGDKKYCWCKATGYKATNASEVSGPASVLSWLFSYVTGSAADCARRCATLCANYAEKSHVFQGVLFIPAQ